MKPIFILLENESGERFLIQLNQVETIDDDKGGKSRIQFKSGREIVVNVGLIELQRRMKAACAFLS